MAEHRLPPDEPVLGFAFDGTGYGDDGAIWGGELLKAEATGYERLAHLRYTPLPGGDAAIANPCRVALAHLYSAGLEWNEDLAPVRHLGEIELMLLRQQLKRDFHCVPTSSMGRLFDAVAALLGLRQQISYEAQAAIDLESCASSTSVYRPYHFDLDGDEIDPTDLLTRLTSDLLDGMAVSSIALGFHVAVAAMVKDLAIASRSTTGISTIALSGGVFQNALLVELCIEHLDRAGFMTLTHRVVPPNDGGISLGQAYIATHGEVPMHPTQSQFVKEH